MCGCSTYVFLVVIPNHLGITYDKKIITNMISDLVSRQDKNQLFATSFVSEKITHKFNVSHFKSSYLCSKDIDDKSDFFVTKSRICLGIERRYIFNRIFCGSINENRHFSAKIIYLRWTQHTWPIAIVLVIFRCISKSGDLPGISMTNITKSG